jgi:hypothetical protein
MMTADADQAKAVFEQNFAQYRILNEQLNRVPAFAVTLTGGFWYIAVVIKSYGPLSSELDSLARCLLMIFAGVCNVMLILIAMRIRNVMQAYEISLKSYAGTSWPDTGQGPRFLGDYSMIVMYSSLILCSAALSFVAAVVLFWPAVGHRWPLGLFGAVTLALVLFAALNYLPKFGRK